MRYVGGKVRQARTIRKAIVEWNTDDRRLYVEPFVGGASVTAEVSSLFRSSMCSDISLDLILFWTAVDGGWKPPSSLTAAQYEDARLGPPSPLRAWAGYAASYNGRWWGGYGPTAQGRDYLAESLRATMKKAEGLHHVTWRSCDYEECGYIGSDTVVYADPPYEGVGGHRGLSNPGSLGYTDLTFDSERFWAVMNEWANMGALVFVSEYVAPEGWVPAISMQRSETMNHRDASSGARPEILWVREDQAAS